MGRKDKKYRRTLVQQGVDKLMAMQQFGIKRKELKELGADGNGIASFETFRTYKKQTRLFLRYVERNHPEITTLKKAKKYIREYLDMRVGLYTEGKLSAATIKTQTSAIHFLFELDKGDSEFYHPPKMERSEIKRSRNSIPGSGIRKLDDFGRATGLRTFKELEVLHGGECVTYSELEEIFKDLNDKRASGVELSREEDDKFHAAQAALQFKNKEFFVIVRKGKGGKLRFAPIMGTNDEVEAVVNRIIRTPAKSRVWGGIPHSTFERMGEHALRAEYASRIYHEYALPIEELEQMKDRVNAGSGYAYSSRILVCRKDKKGLKFDRHALGLCAVALGHSYFRTQDVIDHYSYLF